jgi:hypothetical protein
LPRSPPSARPGRKPPQGASSPCAPRVAAPDIPALALGAGDTGKDDSTWAAPCAAAAAVALRVQGRLDPADVIEEYIRPASARPILDVALRTPVERRLLSEGIAGFDPAIAVSHLDDRTVRLEVPARPGDYPAAAFHALAAEVLVPLHQDVGIDGVSMGGALR